MNQTTTIVPQVQSVNAIQLSAGQTQTIGNFSGTLRPYQFQYQTVQFDVFKTQQASRACRSRAWLVQGPRRPAGPWDSGLADPSLSASPDCPPPLSLPCLPLQRLVLTVTPGLATSRRRGLLQSGSSYQVAIYSTFGSGVYANSQNYTCVCPCDATTNCTQSASCDPVYQPLTGSCSVSIHLHLGARASARENIRRSCLGPPGASPFGLSASARRRSSHSRVCLPRAGLFGAL